MALKITFTSTRANNRPFFRLVVTDGRIAARWKISEALGWYDPLEEKKNIENMSVNAERIQHWLDRGAQLSDNVESFLRKEAP